MELSNLINSISEPQTILMAKLSRALKAEGKDVTDLSLGEPDFDTPEHIKNAAVKALEEGWTKYPPVAGYPELRNAIVTKLKNENNLNYTPEQIVVSTGAKQSLANAFAAIINEGDEVIIPTPYWITYASLVKLFGGKPVFVHCGIEDNFKLSASKLSDAITSKTKALVYSSPCNPSGAVYSKEELESLSSVLNNHKQITVISDEIYEHINYKGEHYSIANIEGMQDRAIIINGFSKGYAMTGWRLGYLAAPVHIAKGCDVYQSQITSGANSIAQRAAIQALLGTQQPTHDMKKAFEERKNYFIPALNDIKGFKIADPEGAFYAFADISYYFGKELQGKLIKDSSDFAMYILENALVTGVSGDAFGAPNCIRFSFATSMENLKKAVEKIKIAVQ